METTFLLFMFSFSFYVGLDRHNYVTSFPINPLCLFIQSKNILGFTLLIELGHRFLLYHGIKEKDGADSLCSHRLGPLSL